MHVKRIQRCFSFVVPAVRTVGSLQSWENEFASLAFCIGIWIASFNFTASLIVCLTIFFWLVTVNCPVSSPSLGLERHLYIEPEEEESTEQNVEHLNPYAALKAKYDRIQTTLVRIQKILDAMASFCEKMVALLAWKDPVATKMATIGVLVAIIGISALGIRTCVCFGLCWMFRPQFLRRPTPPPPLNFFRRLPCESDHIV